MPRRRDEAVNEIAIPYGAYWSTPFARWQGSLAHLHSLTFAAHVARGGAGAARHRSAAFDHGVLGMTVPQRGSLLRPALADGRDRRDRRRRADHQPGLRHRRARAASAAAEIRDGDAEREPRGRRRPHVQRAAALLPGARRGPGGNGEHENWVLDNFARDPFARLAMVQTAENVAARIRDRTAQQNELTLQRYDNTREAWPTTAPSCGASWTCRSTCPTPASARPSPRWTATRASTRRRREGLARLGRCVDGGSVTYGGQTHPADGNAAIVVTTPERAREMRASPDRHRVLGFGQARVEPGYMPEAPVPAAARALAAAGLAIGDMDAIKSHNPFVVNDLVFAPSTRPRSER